MADSFEPKFADLVRNYTSTTGTGNLVLGDAAPGYRSFSAALQPGDRFYYSVTSNDKAAETEVGRGTLQADGSIAREPIDGVATNFSRGTKSIALVTAAEWFERAASIDDVESASQFDAGVPGAVARPMAAKAGEVLSIDDFGAVGDGAADDGPSVRSALAASVGRSLFASTGRSFRLGTWPPHVPSGNLELKLSGATLRGGATQTILSGGFDYAVEGGTFDTFLNGITSDASSGASSDLCFSRVRFRNGENIALNFENSFDRFSVVQCRFDSNRGLMVRAGKNDQTLQDEWQGHSMIANIVTDVLAVADGSTAANGVALSYAPGAILALNHVKGLSLGKDATGFAFYTKSIHGLVLGNTIKGFAAAGGGGGDFYCISLKGNRRADTSSPQGYGAMSIANHISGDGLLGCGLRTQSDEQALIANNVDNFARGMQFDTSISGSIVALNRVYHASGSADFAMAGACFGEAAINIGNASRKFSSGISYSVAATDTLDRLSVLAQHVQGIGAGSGGVALQVIGAGTGNVTNLLLADSTFKGFSAGVNLTQVHGATLTNLSFSDITNMTPAQRAFQFSNCKRIVGRNAQQVSVQTAAGAASPVPIAEVQISNGNVICLRIRVCSRRTDGSAREVIEARCAAYMEGGAVTLGTPTVTREFGTSVGVTFASVAGLRVRANVTGVTGQIWDHFVTVDFDML